jgi:hypothetical protein
MQAKTKRFDCVAMKHAIQQQIAAETAGMTPARYQAYVEHAASAYADRVRPRPGTGGDKGNFKALFEKLEQEQERRGNR